MKPAIIVVCLVISLSRISTAMDKKGEIIESWKKHYVEMVIQNVNNPGITSWEETIKLFQPWVAVSISRRIVERNGGSDLHFFAFINKPQIVEFLLQKANTPNLATANGKTPLHFASEEGSAEAIEYLLKAHANPNLQDNAGETPLHRLAQFYPSFNPSQNWLASLRRLLRYKANVLIPNNNEEKPLDIAVKRGALQLKKVLISATID